jgi:hypothetical protein
MTAGNKLAVMPLSQPELRPFSLTVTELGEG